MIIFTLFLFNVMDRLFPISKISLFFGILAMFMASGCARERRDEVPYAYIHLSLDLSADLANLGAGETATLIPDNNGNVVIRFSNPRYPEITLGSGQIINGNGIIIYRPAGITGYEVYDITCTYRARTDYCRLERSDFEGLYECPCCGSSFLVNSDGYVFEGPAAMPLKRYTAVISNNSLIINN